MIPVVDGNERLEAGRADLQLRRNFKAQDQNKTARSQGGRLGEFYFDHGPKSCGFGISGLRFPFSHLLNSSARQRPYPPAPQQARAEGP